MEVKDRDSSMMTRMIIIDVKEQLFDVVVPVSVAMRMDYELLKEEIPYIFVQMMNVTVK